MERIGYDEGILIRGTPLWIDARKRREWVVLTRPPAARPAAHRRVVMPSFLAERLASRCKFGTVLPTPVGRWVGVAGGLLQFLPLDSPWHVAALLDFDGHRFLVTPGTALADVPECDEIVITDSRPHGSRVSPESLASQLAAFRDSVGETVDVRVASPELACEVCARLRAAGRRVGTRGWLASLVGPGPRHNELSVVLGAAKVRARPNVVVAPPGELLGAADLRIDVALGPGAKEISRLAEASGAEVVTVVGSVGPGLQNTAELRWNHVGVAEQLALG